MILFYLAYLTFQIVVGILSTTVIGLAFGDLGKIMFGLVWLASLAITIGSFISNERISSFERLIGPMHFEPATLDLGKLLVRKSWMRALVGLYDVMCFIVFIASPLIISGMNEMGGFLLVLYGSLLLGVIWLRERAILELSARIKKYQ